ncbi:hypothetical protein J1N35_021457 [Gossypium stocksii]|uniref:Uncharacterized protein n=1 Tax=Gossypium stocksii TaxID=47602 RepID=A0A9D4A076_9ROSI|nr:hypothetical protein J1N35_021457 [Gossypium stocksii]
MRLLEQLKDIRLLLDQPSKIENASSRNFGHSEYVRSKCAIDNVHDGGDA